jgi:GAF domain-containing protein/HAMP domain-containing protein
MSAEPMEFVPHSAEEGRNKVSVVRRTALVLIGMTLLVVAASGISLWFSSAVQRTVLSMRLATDQAISISDLQLDWLAIAGMLDTLSVTRPTPDAKQKLDLKLADLNRQLSRLASDPLGLSAEKISENRLIAERLQKTGREMTGLIQELYSLVEAGRWGTALQKRQTTMATFQAHLTDDLQQLNSNIQSDVTTQVSRITQLENLARTFALIAILAGILISAMAMWFMRHTILLPVNKLIADVQQVSLARTAAELPPLAPLVQQDEIGELSRALARMVSWLRESYGKLEEQVEERTSRLQRKSIQLEAAAQVGREITATRDLETLLYRAVNTIRERFDFYHAGIFLIDQPHEYAILQSATGDAGREMLAHGHRLRVGETGLVGHVANEGEARVASDVGQDAVHFKNPLLPNTRSEAALPLRASGKVIGVLDVQSLEADAFDPESISTLQIMADQLAIAIENTRLLQESQDSLNELEATYTSYNRQAWERFIHGSQVSGYEFDGMNATPLLRMDLKRGREGLTRSGDERPGFPMQIPLRVRGETIGTLEVRKEEQEFSDAEVFLLATISNRLSQILDSARLYEEAQLHAVREQMSGEITAKIRASLDMETVLRTAMSEIAQRLGIPQVEVQLGRGAARSPGGIRDKETAPQAQKGDGHYD